VTLFKYYLSLFIFLVLFLGVPCVSYGAGVTRTIRVGIYNNEPKIYQDSDGKAAGVYADILNFIAKKENWKVEYVFGLWEEGLSRLKKGEIDVLVDVAFSEDREKQFDFTKETVLNSWGVIYVKNNSPIDSFLGLENKRISVLKSSVYEEGREGIIQYLVAFGINAVMVEVDSYDAVLTLVDTGVADAAIVSHFFGLAHRKEYPNLRATKIFLKPTELRFALTKGDVDNQYLIERLDYWVKKLRQGYDGYYLKSLEKYGLIETEPQANKQAWLVPNWVLPFCLGAASAFIFSWLIKKFPRLRKKKLNS